MKAAEQRFADSFLMDVGALAPALGRQEEQEQQRL
jgi:hypothetical protein